VNERASLNKNSRSLLTFGLPETVVLTLGLIFFVYVLQTYFWTKQFAIGYMLTSMIAIITGVFAIFTAIILYAISDYTERARQ